MDRVSTIGKTIAEVVYQTATYLLPIVAIISLLQYWTEITPCFQRQGVTITCFLVYWRFSKPEIPHFIWEVLQFTIIFWIAHQFNEEQEFKEPDCLDHQDIYPLFLLKTVFNVLRIAYTLTLLFFLVFILGAIVYTIVDQFYLEPLRRRQASLSSQEFDSLQVIEYNSGQQNLNEQQITCSICLIDFENGERIISLPICEHYYHRQCIREWLNFNGICPYCRSDIKVNLVFSRVNRNNERQRQSPRVNRRATLHLNVEEVGGNQ